MFVQPKKKLGQHFLNDQNIALKIVEAIEGQPGLVIEIGPGMGVLTQYLVKKIENFVAIEIDHESVEYLTSNGIISEKNLFRQDFLRTDLQNLLKDNTCIIGNLPYNISSQIFFKVLENKEQITQVVCMIQKEVAERIAEPPGSKTYGILSVFLQAFYDIEYLFTVHEHVFTPPPKVKSAVIRLKRNNRTELPCNEKMFFTVVKTAFNQRRKTMRNSLRQLYTPEVLVNPIFDKRPERLGVEEFIELTKMLEINC
jgi:16S rRNA (adenine1518-N6/adenine1519-N6)-dimethyltransferase